LHYSPDPSSQRTSSLSSDRLRKAIERNKSKQTKRSKPTLKSRLLGSKETGDAPARRQAPPTGNTATRRAVATRAEDLEFSTEIRKSPRKAPAPVNYVGATRRATTTRATSRTANTRTRVASKQSKFFVYCAWAFCGVLMLRLIFSEGGVIDYYSSHSVFKDKIYEHKSIIKENVALVAEIQKIKSNGKYQKKLVRDNLGFIGRDEFLILFPKENSSPSI
jgi:cell division protein FtsB